LETGEEINNAKENGQFANLRKSLAARRILGLIAAASSPEMP
jgi:hypothetical protein